jgi:hypothetical protein
MVIASGRETLRIEYKGLMTQHRKLLLILYTGVKQANTQ